MEKYDTREHGFKVRGATFKGDVRGNFFFTQRVVSAWNILLGVKVEADTIVAFKTFLLMDKDFVQADER